MSSKTKKIIITGTHLTPALELIRQLQSDTKYSWQISFIGRNFNSTTDPTPSIESQIIPRMNIPFFGIDVGKLDRRWLPNTLKGIPSTLKSFNKISQIISQINPDIIVSFGGYVSVPVIVESRLKKIPSITHEQTLTNSLTTKINSFFVDKIALSFNNPSQKKLLPKHKVAITGNLLRYQIFSTKSDKFSNLIKNPKKIIFITAGNQGSAFINQLFLDSYKLIKGFTVIHQTGAKDFPKIKTKTKKLDSYYTESYIQAQDIGWVLNHAEIVISRAGANTCQELLALNKKAIIIPLLVSQQDEQQKNALWLKQNNPQNIIVLPQSDLQPQTLADSIDKLANVKTISKPTKSQINYKLFKLIHATV